MTGFPFNNELNSRTGALGPRMSKTERLLSDLRGLFQDQSAVTRILENEDPLVYEVYNVPIAEEDGELQHCTSVVYPGVVGEEFFMTTGHFHAKRGTAEVYLCLTGTGVLVMQDEDGTAACLEMTSGTVSYIPPGWAHRSVNTGGVPLVLYCVYPGDAGHDYGALREKGFAKLILKDGASYALADNPAYR